MEFTVALTTGAAALERIDEALRAVDPAALVDAQGGALRIAGAFDVATLRALLREAGHAVEPGDIRQLPSVCCGGCSG
ncbi:MAG TPA: hypothetical protein VGD21_07975 [Lysobacter sp.]